MSVITNTIEERLSDAGVTIDGLLVKDGGLPSLPGAAITSDQAASLAVYHAALAAAAGGKALMSVVDGETLELEFAPPITWCYSSIDLSDGNLDGDNPLEINVSSYVPGASGASIIGCLVYMEEMNGAGSVQFLVNVQMPPSGVGYLSVGQVFSGQFNSFFVIMPLRDNKLYVRRLSSGGADAGVAIYPLFYA
ncbi:MAG: hypothetical protein IAE79_28285 [Anaerolinea sp.]|nr:hypothetical protein [Anaerolinea sp.]